MTKLVPPHGGHLISRLLEAEELHEEKKRAKTLPKVYMASRETSDLIMIGMGAFSPLNGFMGSEIGKGSVMNTEWLMEYFGLFPLPFHRIKHPD